MEAVPLFSWIRSAYVGLKKWVVEALSSRGVVKETDFSALQYKPAPEVGIAGFEIHL